MPNPQLLTLIPEKLEQTGTIQALNEKRLPALSLKAPVYRCGKYWIRTSDPLLVRQVL